MNDKELAARAENDVELRRLLAEHQELDRQVDALNRRHVRTPAEELERKRLSKLKLASKDRIAQIVARRPQDAGQE
jgi:uncharacterized protein YdcH (DUF465 family)